MQFDNLNNFAATLLPYLLGVKIDGAATTRAGQRAAAHLGRPPAGGLGRRPRTSTWCGGNLLELTFDDQLPEALWPDGGARWYDVVAGCSPGPNDPWWDDAEHRRRHRDPRRHPAPGDESMPATSSPACSRRRPERLDVGPPARAQPGEPDTRAVRHRPGRVAAQPRRLPVGGGEAAVDATGWSAAEGYQVDWAPSMRMVVSLADLDDSRWINLTGVSGHAFNATTSTRPSCGSRARRCRGRSAQSAVRLGRRRRADRSSPVGGALEPEPERHPEGVAAAVTRRSWARRARRRGSPRRTAARTRRCRPGHGPAPGRSSRRPCPGASRCGPPPWPGPSTASAVPIASTRAGGTGSSSPNRAEASDSAPAYGAQSSPSGVTTGRITRRPRAVNASRKGPGARFAAGSRRRRRRWPRPDLGEASNTSARARAACAASASPRRLRAWSAAGRAGRSWAAEASTARP